MKVKKSFRVNPYGSWITIIITDEVQKESDKIGIGFKANWAAVTHFGKNGNIKIVFGKKQENGSIAHEAIHAALHIFEEFGIKVDYYNDEPFTYLVQWIVDRVDKMYEGLRNAVAKELS